MKCVLKPAPPPVLASQRLFSAPPTVQKAVTVMLASYSMDRLVLKRLSVDAMRMEKLIRYD